MRGAFITGTDTNIGKTRTTKLLLKWLQQRDQNCIGLKPVSCGDRADAEELLYASSFEELTIEQVNPVAYASPVAPLVAARIEGDSLSCQEIVSHIKQVDQELDRPVCLIEGVGGWEVPLADGSHQADIASACNLPVILVVDNKLGALNHTLLTAAAIRSKGLTLAGLIFNHIADSLDLAAITNKSVIPELSQSSILAEILHNDPALLAEPELETLFN